MNTETERLTAELVAAQARIASLSQQLDAEIAKRAKMELAAGRAAKWLRAERGIRGHHPTTCKSYAWQAHEGGGFSCKQFEPDACTCEFGRALAGLEGK